ncbi:heterokaryon incompatibility protein-domain-containing protein [Penicillium herquei]|nr:heterokaryon incompatibility protein-domain-containing protein [Penicillium herquei]
MSSYKSDFIELVDFVPRKCSHQPYYTPYTLPLSTETNFDGRLVADWYRKCRTGHHTCQQRDLDANGWLWVPTRLLHVDIRKGIVRLIETNVHCFSADRSYTALSYRWPTSGQQPITLTKSTITQLMTGISTSSLRGCIRDAITVTNLLGFSYLWVDALCICQDDKSDWLFESLQMFKVYSNSAITISASGILSSESGLLQKRCPNYLAEASFIPLASPNPHARLIVTIEKVWENIVSEGLLSSRGWIFQERIASNRILHLGAGSMAWECNGVSLIESNLPEHIPVSFDVGAMKKSAFYSDLSIGNFILETWTAIVEDYTQRKFTNHSDILIAINGIAEKIASATQNRSWFLSGMWSHTIAFELPWERKKKDRTLYQQDSAFTNAPSWSWASVQGQVTYPIHHTIKIMGENGRVNTVQVPRLQGYRPLQPLISVNNFSFLDKDHRHSICRSLHIACCLSTLRFHTVTQDDDPVGLSINGQLVNPKLVHAKLIYDCDMSQNEIQASSNAGEHLFIPTFCSHAGCFGIIVTYHNAKAYRRIGSLSLYTEFFSQISLDLSSDFANRVYDILMASYEISEFAFTARISMRSAAAAFEVLGGNFGILEDQDTEDANTYTLAQIAKNHLVIACLPAGSYGSTRTAIVAQNMVRTFSKS